MSYKPCGECGTLLQENKFGHDDCPKCNSENFFLMPSKKVKKSNILKEGDEETKVVSEKEKLIEEVIEEE